MPRLARRYRDLSRPVTELGFDVFAPEDGVRLDVALRAHFAWRSRESFHRLLDRGDVLLNGAVRKASTRLRAGDRVTVRIPVAEGAPERESADGLVVLHEDDVLVAVDKPAGVVAHPTGRIRHGTLINQLHARYRREGRDDVVPRLAHRLDRDTSGVLLVVKDRRADAEVTRAFFRREVTKTYRALVVGHPRADHGFVDAPLGSADDAETKLQMAVREGGAPSRTRWRVLERLPGHAYVELEPLTGRTHQLRVHMAHLGHPIVADHLYGDLRPLRRSTVIPSLPDRDDAVLLDRLALHAMRLELRHPSTGAPMRFESPVPADLLEALDGLRALASAGRPRAATLAARPRALRRARPALAS
jgi:23S rRNA pseudouridine1911/1915/1917 synthase